MFTLHYAPDNASLIIRLALEELAIPYATKLVDRSVSAQSSADYLKLNPMGMIPALETPDGVMFETAAILLYLTERAGRMAPAPGTPDRAPFLSWLFATSNGVHSDLRHMFYAERYASGEVARHREMSKDRLRAHLGRLDGLASQRHNWFGADTPSVLDIYVAVILRWLALYPRGDSDWFRLSDWPALSALAKRIETRPSMASAIAAEGLGPSPLTAPALAKPPEGVAL